jgi:hypothetical protein
MANSLFTGLFEHYGKYLPNQLPTSFNPSTMFLGQVLSVVTGEEVEEAIGNGDLDSISPSEAHKYIGLITFKMQGPDDSKYEDQSGRLAFPLDRSSHRLPLPGELVLVIAGFSGADVSQFKAFFYTKVITGAFPVRDAIQPYAITNSKKVTTPTSGQQDATKELISSRFEKRFSHNSSTIKKEGKVIPTMREGDKLLEGRFGGSIRFTSTIEKKDVWPTSSDNDSINKGSNDGDPFLIIKATKETDDSNASSQDNVELGDDNINADMRFTRDSLTSH